MLGRTMAADDATLPSAERPARGTDPDATFSSRPVVSSFELLFSEPGRPSSPQPPPPPPGGGTGRVTVPPFLEALTPLGWGHRELTPRRTIGRGGQGEIWEAVQVSLNRTIAVKRLLEPAGAARSAADSAWQKETFLREAVTAARLEHPNIVPVHDLKETDDGAPLLVMKRLEGRPWSDAVEADRAALPEADFLARHLGVLVAVSRAVAFAHGQGVMHRDLKPAQVVLGSFGEVTLLDWGLAASFAPSPQGDWIAPPVSSADNPAGTPSYMAPEQATKDPSRLGPWTDVYLLGGILWYLAAGVRPHEGAGLTEIYLMAGKGVVTPPSSRLRPPAELLDLARAALAPRPEDRPQSAGEFLARLEAIVSGATRRQEARKIVEAARPALERTDDGLYAELPRVRADLERARLLAPDDPDVATVEDAATQRLAEEALRRGDLGFARFAAGSVADAGRRAALLDAVAAGEARRKRERAQRRAALGAVVVLLVAGLAGALLFLREERRLGDEARRQKERAHALSGFLVESFTKRLEELGRHELLAAVTEPVVAYYRDEATGPLAPAETLEYARALRLSAAALAEEGAIPEALRRAEEAVSLLSRLDPAARGVEGTLRLGRAHRTRAAIQARLGHLEAALADSEAAVAAVEPLAKARPSDPGVAFGLAGARADHVARLWAAGRHGRAEAETNDASAAIERAVSLSPGELGPARQRALFACEGSYRAVTDGRVEEAIRLARRATELSSGLVEAFPGSAAPLSVLSCAHGSAVMALALTDPAEGVVEAEAGLDAARGALALDPSSRIARLDLVLCLARSGYARLKAARTAEAGAVLDEAGRELDDLLARDGRRLPRLLAHGLVLRLRGLAAWHARDAAGALRLLDASRAQLEEAAKLSPESLEAAVRLANTSLDEAAMLRAAGRPAEAPPLLSASDAKLVPFFSGHEPGRAARLSRARLLAALGRDAEATALLLAGGPREGPGAAPVLFHDLSPGSLVMAF
jgi:hypothetical protein